jgi:hypothetical protein
MPIKSVAPMGFARLNPSYILMARLVAGRVKMAASSRPEG